MARVTEALRVSSIALVCLRMRARSAALVFLMSATTPDMWARPFLTVLALAVTVLVKDAILESNMRSAALRALDEAVVAAAVAALRVLVAASWASACFWSFSLNFWVASERSLAMARWF